MPECVLSLKRICRIRLLTLAALLFACLYAFQVSAEDSRGRLSDELSADESEFKHAPLSLADGSSITVISPQEWRSIGSKLSHTLEGTHQHFAVLLGMLPTISTSLRLMNEESFYRSTGAPRWTNALYFRGQIIIPLPGQDKIDMDNINRSIKHEYTHAIINALSAGRCPGWLDEGLAQWAEGAENPALRPALANYLRSNSPVALSLLQGGFTRLERDMVAAAYAQSLIASQALMQTFGFTAIRRYLDLLKEGQEKPAAFRRAFSLSDDTFEDRLGEKLTSWARSAKSFSQPEGSQSWQVAALR